MHAQPGPVNAVPQPRRSTTPNETGNAVKKKAEKGNKGDKVGMVYSAEGVETERVNPTLTAENDEAV